MHALKLLSAATLASASTSYPSPASTAPNFRLVAVAKDPAAHPTTWTLTSYHLSACYDVAILEPHNTTDPTGRDFYLNGTAPAKSDLLTDGGSPPTPYGLTIPQEDQRDDDDRRAVQIICGEGTPGVSIGPGKRGLLRLGYEGEEFGSWYACGEMDLPFGPAVVLNYRGRGEELGKGCFDLVLRPECAGDMARASENARSGRCYEEVKGA